MSYLSEKGDRFLTEGLRIANVAVNNLQRQSDVAVSNILSTINHTPPITSIEKLYNIRAQVMYVNSTTRKTAHIPRQTDEILGLISTLQQGPENSKQDDIAEIPHEKH